MEARGAIENKSLTELGERPGLVLRNLSQFY
jgi:hypothetical protein